MHTCIHTHLGGVGAEPLPPPQVMQVIPVVLQLNNPLLMKLIDVLKFNDNTYNSTKYARKVSLPL